jgi:hypothetical protein
VLNGEYSGYFIEMRRALKPFSPDPAESMSSKERETGILNSD